MLKDKIRIYVLAKELDVDCKDLIALCHRLGFDIKNQLSSLEPVQREQVETIISKGGLNTAGIAPSGTTSPTVPAPAVPTVIAPTKPPTILKPAAVKKETSTAKTPKGSESAPASKSLPHLKLLLKKLINQVKQKGLQPRKSLPRFLKFLLSRK